MSKTLPKLAIAFGIALTSSEAIAIRHTPEEFSQQNEARAQASTFMNGLSFNITYEGNNEKANALCNELASRVTVAGPIAYCHLTKTPSQERHHEVVFDINIEGNHFGRYTFDLSPETPQEEIEAATNIMQKHIMQTYDDLFSQATDLYLKGLQENKVIEMQIGLEQ